MSKYKTLRDLVFELIGEFKGLKDAVRKQNGALIDHDKRIDKNKERIDITTGKTAGIAAVFGFLGALGALIIGFLRFWDK